MLRLGCLPAFLGHQASSAMSVGLMDMRTWVVVWWIAMVSFVFSLPRRCLLPFVKVSAQFQKLLLLHGLGQDNT